MKRIRIVIFPLIFAVGVVFAAEGRLTLPAEEIQQKCFREAGIPENDSNHVVTEEEMDTVVECAERYIDRS